VLRELPTGRKEIRTYVRTPEALAKMWPWLRERVANGEQAFVVTPRIDPSDGEEDAPSAIETYDELRTGPLKGLKLALLHGRMPAKERDATMRAFAARELDVLVATTVVEVGIDVPNATVMVVLGAERFGLAQLHQLRGRVGRGSEQSYCLLVSRPVEDLSETADKRLQALVDTTDGFELAQIDLDLRREGQLLGTRQSGWSDLQFTKLRVDHALIERARDIAAELRDEDGPWQDEADRLYTAGELAA
jgi:ATP-dependent DNA helicase RecG